MSGIALWYQRWVKQQTRWSKSFFREAFWFPASFAYQSWWMLVETTKQALYPFILVATVFHFLFHPADSFRPVAWLVRRMGPYRQTDGTIKLTVLFHLFRPLCSESL